MKIRMVLLLALAAVCAGCAPAPAPAPDTAAQDQAAIRALEDKFAAAFNAKDSAAIMGLYVNDESLVVFDVTGPRQYTGWPAYKKDWDDYFAESQGTVTFSLSDLEVTVGGNLAYSHSIQRVVSTNKKGRKTDLTVRVTDVYKKVNGQWLICHEHVSVPVDLDAMRPVLDSK